MDSNLTIGLAQISPIWLNRKATTEKMLAYISDAANKGCELVTFGEAILPGYPFWLALTNGAEFNSKLQKEIFAYQQRFSKLEIFYSQLRGPPANFI